MTSNSPKWPARLAVLALSLLTLAPAALADAGEVVPTARQVEVFVGDRLADKTGPKEGYHTFRIPSLVRLASGDLVAICEGRRDSEKDNGKIDLVLKRSSDGGRTWGKLELIYGEEGAITIGNPVPIVARDGTLHLVCSRNNRLGLLYLASRDGGRTWSKPREIFDAKGEPGTAATTKVPMFAVLTKKLGTDVQRLSPGPGHGVQLASGRLVVPMHYTGMDTVPYAGPALPAEALQAAGVADYKPDKREVIFNGVIYSDDGGNTWHTGALGPRGATETAVAALADGRLLLNARFLSGTYRVISESRDGGATLTGHRLATDLIDVACEGSLLPVPLPGSKDEGLLFCNPAVKGVGFSRRAHLTLRLSRDGGTTWPQALELDAGPAAYSDLADLGGGQIGVLYERGAKEYHERIAFSSVRLAEVMAATPAAGQQ